MSLIALLELAVFSVLLLASCFFYIIFTKEQKKNLEILEFIFESLSQDDAIFKSHSLHVFYLSQLFYEYIPFKYKVGLSANTLAICALVHDIGKTAIPKKILYKPGKLTKEELELVRRHTEIGSKKIMQNKNLHFLSNAILRHHERVDGSGYEKLSGKKIPVEARIISIVDAYTAIIMANSFKPSRSYSDAIISLKMSAGTQFDKELVEIFCSIPQARVNECTHKVEEKLKYDKTSLC